MIPIGKTEPSITFPVGAVIEDPTIIGEILYKYPKTRTGHLYKVKVLKWKLEVPERVKEHLEKPDEIHISVFEENMGNIKRLS
jgi:hypothetical protein